jgi:hypothetical protein
LENRHSTFNNKLIAYVNKEEVWNAVWQRIWQDDEGTIHRILAGRPSMPSTATVVLDSVGNSPDNKN